MTETTETGRVEVGCPSCTAAYLYLMDVAEAEYGEVEFLACFHCKRGYTRYGKQMELIT